MAVHLLPLLKGEALSTVHSLPVAARSLYLELRHALVDRLSLTQEGHRQWFRWALCPGPPATGHRLVGRWLLQGARSAQEVVKEVVREDFLWNLPARSYATPMPGSGADRIFHKCISTNNI